MNINCKYTDDNKLLLETIYGFRRYTGEAYLRYYKMDYPEFCDVLKLCHKEYFNDTIYINEPIDLKLSLDPYYKYPFQKQISELKKEIQYIYDLINE